MPAATYTDQLTVKMPTKKSAERVAQLMSVYGASPFKIQEVVGGFKVVPETVTATLKALAEQIAPAALPSAQIPSPETSSKVKVTFKAVSASIKWLVDDVLFVRKLDGTCLLLTKDAVHSVLPSGGVSEVTAYEDGLDKYKFSYDPGTDSVTVYFPKKVGLKEITVLHVSSPKLGHQTFSKSKLKSFALCDTGGTPIVGMTMPVKIAAAKGCLDYFPGLKAATYMPSVKPPIATVPMPGVPGVNASWDGTAWSEKPAVSVAGSSGVHKLTLLKETPLYFVVLVGAAKVWVKKDHITIISKAGMIEFTVTPEKKKLYAKYFA